MARLERAAALAGRVVAAVPGPQQPLYWLALGQIRAHQNQIARFCRFPHRNVILGKSSTGAELANLHLVEPGRRLRRQAPGAHSW